MTPTAYRLITSFSRTVTCELCLSGRSHTHRLAVGRSVGGSREARYFGKASGPHPAQAPEWPYFPRFEAEAGEMRENKQL
jgi:hypothetical protein